MIEVEDITFWHHERFTFGFTEKELVDALAEALLPDTSVLLGDSYEKKLYKTELGYQLEISRSVQRGGKKDA